MGARSSPEGCRVAAGRYGLPVRKRAVTVRRLPIVGVLLVAVVIAGSCSGGGGQSKSSRSSGPNACTFVAKIDQIANTVKRANVSDPIAFKKTLDSAVRNYVTNVRELRAVAPVALHADLERFEADVQQYRFDAAVADRVALDAYAARTCGRVAKAVTTTSGPATTGATGSTPTTSLSGG
jgi:hypothetical protein